MVMDDLRRLLLSSGTALFGFGDLTPLPAEAREGFPHGISIGVALKSSAGRLGTMLSDAPAPVSKPIETSRYGTCMDYVEHCPAGTPNGRDWRTGMEREEFFDTAL